MHTGRVDEGVTSDVANPVLAAVYLLVLPVWLLIFVLQLGTEGPNRLPLLVASGALLALSVSQFFKGLALFRQRVEADAAGLRLRGVGGFAVPWEGVEALDATRVRGQNLRLRVRAGHEIPGDFVVLRSRTRGIGVEPDAVDPLRELAAAHGVRVGEH